jgi:hypothetical protein
MCYIWSMIVVLLWIHEISGGRLVSGPPWENYDLYNIPTDDVTGLVISWFIDVPPYPRVIRSKTYRSHVKLQIITNTVYIVIFM